MTEHHKKCYQCGLPISFKRLPNGKWCPTNPDGSDHWDDCSQEKWKKKGGIQYLHYGFHTGKNFKKNYDKHDTSTPWE